MAKPVPRLSAAQIASVIQTAWDDRPPFNAVLMSHGLTQGQLVQLLRRELSPTAYKLWAARSRGAAPAPSPSRRGPPKPTR